MRLYGTPEMPAFVDNVTDGTALTFNQYWDLLDRRLNGLELLDVSWQSAIADVTTIGLSRLNEFFAPSIDKFARLAELGFLTAPSTTPKTLALGQTIMVIDAGDQRDLFTPTPFVTIVREDEDGIDDWAVAQRLAWNKENGELSLDILIIHGDPGPHDDWLVTASAGMLVGMDEIRATVAADKATVAADKGIVAADKATVASDKADTNTAKLLAQDWASKAENSVVSGGLYSALHWAAKAAASAVAAAASAAAAAVFDPSSYWTKAQSYSSAQTDTAIANAISAVRAGVGSALDTLAEFATAINNDASFAATMTTALSGKAAAEPLVVRTTDVTVASWTRNKVDSSAGARIITLPAAPADGDVVSVWRRGANQVRIARNGKQINGQTDDLILDEDYQKANLTYVSSTIQWRFTVGKEF